MIRAETFADSSTTTRCLLSISPWTVPNTRIERSDRTVPSMVAPSPMTVSPSSIWAARPGVASNAGVATVGGAGA